VSPQVPRQYAPLSKKSGPHSKTRNSFYTWPHHKAAANRIIIGYAYAKTPIRHLKEQSPASYAKQLKLTPHFLWELFDAERMCTSSQLKKETT
jgi:hypothetical protein